jgi:Acetyltransferases, including N-acetylases of ribosomal proteins
MPFAFPEQIETERLILRPPRPGDGAEVNAAIRETFDQLHRWMEWAERVPTPQQTEENRIRARERYLQGEDYSVQGYLKGDGTLALLAGLHPRSADMSVLEIGYWCRASCQGHGYVTEAVRALTRTAFADLRIRRVEIRCDARNAPSRAVAERAGYPLDFVLPGDPAAPDGSPRDTCVYALTREQFAALATPPA